jgi:hypothetical protein
MSSMKIVISCDNMFCTISPKLDLRIGNRDNDFISDKKDDLNDISKGPRRLAKMLVV